MVESTWWATLWPPNQPSYLVR